jgi:hypothetical protein
MIEAETEEDADRKVTAACSCEEGQSARRIDNARVIVERDFKDFSGETVDLVQRIVAAVNFGVIGSASVKLDGTTKVTVALTSKDKIAVVRTDTEVYKEEI